MENPFGKGFSKPFPKLFGWPLLRNGLRFLIVLRADVIIMMMGTLSLRSILSIVGSAQVTIASVEQFNRVSNPEITLLLAQAAADV